MGMYDKQQSSRPLNYQNISWAGTGTSFSTTFGPQTFQIRVMSQLAGWASIAATTSTNFTQPTTAGGVGMWIPNVANTAEYFAVSPGQVFSFSSTTTSSGAFISVTEMT